MKSVILKAIPRDGISNKSVLNAIRKEGNVPATIYGGKENINFHVNSIAFLKLINTAEVHLVDLDFGDKTIRSVIREVQFHPVTDEPIHVDFMQVFDDKPVTIGVPVKFVGTPVGVLKGGKKREKIRKLVLKALPADIPEEVEVDVTKVKIGHGIKVEEIKLKNVEFLDHPKAVVMAVKTARVLVEDTIDEEDEEEAEGAEVETTDATSETEQGASAE
tara:strand:- start:1319 stop:1972 length:654 start_codon:yes stop_codon:yes gene_type:complete